MQSISRFQRTNFCYLFFSKNPRERFKKNINCINLNLRKFVKNQGKTIIALIYWILSILIWEMKTHTTDTFAWNFLERSGKTEKANFYEHTYTNSRISHGVDERRNKRQLYVTNIQGLGAAFQFSSDPIVIVRGCSSVSIEVTRLVNV